MFATDSGMNSGCVGSMTRKPMRIVDCGASGRSSSFVTGSALAVAASSMRLGPSRQPPRCVARLFRRSRDRTCRRRRCACVARRSCSRRSRGCRRSCTTAVAAARRKDSAVRDDSERAAQRTPHRPVPAGSPAARSSCAGSSGECAAARFRAVSGCVRISASSATASAPYSDSTSSDSDV